MTEATTRTVAELEDDYCRVVNGRDWNGVTALFATGFTFTHRDGTREDAATFVARMQGYRSYHLDRISLDIQSYGDVSIAMGVLATERYDRDGSENQGSTKPTIHIWTRSAEGAGWTLQAHISITDPG